MDKLVNGIYDSMEYDKFKFFEKYNRKTIKKSVEYIAKKMLEKGWQGHPVIVNRDFFLIDGQNRKEAAEKAKIAVRYMMIDDYTKDDIQQVNSGTHLWEIENHMRLHINSGKKDYKYLQDFAKTSGIGLVSAGCILTNGNNKWRGEGKTMFNEGKWKPTTKRQALNFLSFLNSLKYENNKGGRFVIPMYSAYLKYDFNEKDFIANMNKFTANNSVSEYNDKKYSDFIQRIINYKC